MDQKQRIERLKAEVNRLAGGDARCFGIDQMPLTMAEQFLQRVIAFETAPMTTDFAQLTADGVPLPTPDMVPDDEMHAVLWRVIAALANHRVFLERTNHLSDRELYSVLWHNVLREEHAVLPAGDTGAWHVHVPGDDEHATNYLSYYATERQREVWRRDDLGRPLPPRKTAEHDRDRHLPVPRAQRSY